MHACGDHHSGKRLRMTPPRIKSHFPSRANHFLLRGPDVETAGQPLISTAEEKKKPAPTRSHLSCIPHQRFPRSSQKHTAPWFCLFSSDSHCSPHLLLTAVMDVKPRRRHYVIHGNMMSYKVVKRAWLWRNVSWKQILKKKKNEKCLYYKEGGLSVKCSRQCRCQIFTVIRVCWSRSRNNSV